jgi:hypothetical protein
MISSVKPLRGCSNRETPFANPVGIAGLTSRRNFSDGVGAFGTSMKYEIVMRKCGDGKFRPYKLPLTLHDVTSHFDEFYVVVDRGHSTPCWEWQNPRRTQKSAGKYGIRTIAGTKFVASRLSWGLYRGPIPEGQCVLHHCDNPPCVNPDHLFLGTKLENNQDRHRKGRDVFRVGEKHWAAILDESKVMQIREWHRGGWKLTQLAKQFKISMSLCWRIVNRRCWKHLP